MVEHKRAEHSVEGFSGEVRLLKSDAAVFDLRMRVFLPGGELLLPY